MNLALGLSLIQFGKMFVVVLLQMKITMYLLNERRLEVRVPEMIINLGADSSSDESDFEFFD
jgi:hypothetical protein